MSRWLSSILAFLLAVLLLVSPCRAMLTTPDATGHDCCEQTKKEHSRDSSDCQTRCAALTSDRLLKAGSGDEEAGVPMIRLAHGPANVTPAAITLPEPVPIEPVGHLYLQNSSLLI